jgi:hypothetical protein
VGPVRNRDIADRNSALLQLNCQHTLHLKVSSSG